ncbi:MAG: hypothetical protein HZB40_15870 [Rhodocyclales bacterium]|nr:hypothetical protein [Rhodocyclales bacterium]
MALAFGGVLSDQTPRQDAGDVAALCCQPAPARCDTSPPVAAAPAPATSKPPSTAKAAPIAAAINTPGPRCTTTSCIAQASSACNSKSAKVLSLSDQIQATLSAVVDLLVADRAGIDDVLKALQRFLDTGERLLKLLAGLGTAASLAIFLLIAYLTRDAWSRLLWHAWLRRPDRPRGREIFLLEGQCKVVESIAGMMGRLDAGQPGILLGLKGDWGNGKSFVLAATRDMLESTCADAVVVPVNIWEHQRELDLHFALVKAVLSHPRLLARCVGAYPVHLLFVPLLMAVIRMLPNGWALNFEVSRMAFKADVPVSVPLPWQGGFRRVVEAANREGLKLVMILDEIDRADPEVAQAAITLARRALDLPGVMTILPYVEAQIRHKVFNPLTAKSPDLRATMFAVIDQAFPGRDGMYIFPDDDQQIIENKYRNALLELWLRPPGTVAGDLDATERARYYLYRRFAEKYLTNSIELASLVANDLIPLLSNSVVTSHLWADACRGIPTGRLIEVLPEYIDGSPLLASVLLPSHRAFEGRMVWLLSEFAKWPGSDKPRDGIRQVELMTLMGVACLLSDSRPPWQR